MVGGQLPGGFVQRTGGLAQVELRNLPARACAGVGHGGLYAHAGPVDRHGPGPEGEGCVGKPVAEGEQRGLARCVKVAVPHIDAFAVQRIIGAGKIAGARIVIGGGPGGGQLA